MIQSSRIKFWKQNERPLLKVTIVVGWYIYALKRGALTFTLLHVMLSIPVNYDHPWGIQSSHTRGACMYHPWSVYRLTAAVWHFYCSSEQQYLTLYIPYCFAQIPHCQRFRMSTAIHHKWCILCCYCCIQSSTSRHTLLTGWLLAESQYSDTQHLLAGKALSSDQGNLPHWGLRIGWCWLDNCWRRQ